MVQEKQPRNADNPVLWVVRSYPKGVHRVEQLLIPLSAGGFSIDRRRGGRAKSNNLLVLDSYKSLEVMCVDCVNFCFEGSCEVYDIIPLGQRRGEKQATRLRNTKVRL